MGNEEKKMSMSYMTYTYDLINILPFFILVVIQVYALTSNAEEGEVEQFYEDLQDLLE